MHGWHRTPFRQIRQAAGECPGRGQLTAPRSPNIVIESNTSGFRDVRLAEKPVSPGFSRV
jgi:hypothetical protein